MADFRAIEGVTRALVQLLRMSYDAADFDSELEFEAYVPENLEEPMSSGVSVFVYRAAVNGTHRMPPGRILPDGRKQQTQVRVDVHLLFTIWAQEAFHQHRMAGWLMRSLEDFPVLPFALLEASAPGVFHPGETVEIVAGDLSNDDLLHIWETLVEKSYQLSIPYVARNISIESSHTMTAGELVQTRLLDMAIPRDE